jgi:hypothetical protein
VLCEGTSEIKAVLLYIEKVFVATKEATDKADVNYPSFCTNRSSFLLCFECVVQIPRDV